MNPLVGTAGAKAKATFNTRSFTCAAVSRQAAHNLVLIFPRSNYEGGIAQLVERLLCKQDVRSSSLLASTNRPLTTGHYNGPVAQLVRARA